MLRVFYGVHTTVTGADGVQQEQRLPCARVTVSRRGFTPAVVTVVEGQVVAFESVPSFAPPAAEKDKDKEKAKEKGKAKLPDELPMPPGGYNVVQLSQDGAQFKVMPGGRNFRLESTQTLLLLTLTGLPLTAPLLLRPPPVSHFTRSPPRNPPRPLFHMLTCSLFICSLCAYCTL